MRYKIILGWLQDSRFKGVTLSDGAKADILKCLDGTSLYATSEMNTVIGKVTVQDKHIYVDVIDTESDTVGLSSVGFPALSIQGNVWTGSGRSKDVRVEAVRVAHLFLTSEDNGGSFERCAAKQIRRWSDGSNRNQERSGGRPCTIGPRW